MPARDRRRLVVTMSGEIHIKSRRTARWFVRRLRGNLDSGLARAGVRGTVRDEGPWLTIDADDIDRASEVAASTFGVHRVENAVHLSVDDLPSLVDQVARRARHRVRGRTFAVRVKRRGTHPWTSMDAQREIGAALVADAAGVDLETPEVEVLVQVHDRDGWLVEDSREGPQGLPLGTQEGALAMLSGGFDSPVAAWLLMRRGCPVDFVHCTLDCAVSDQAATVAHELWRRWGGGTSPVLWVVDFQPVKDALLDRVPSRLRQVVLKQLMVRAADAVAERAGAAALVTGESVGQVSSQTLTHLAEIDRVVDRTVLRPLAGATKHEIIDRARLIGTEAISARAREVCDLSDGPVAIRADRATLDGARDALPERLLARALAGTTAVALESWSPGMPLVPVVDRVPEGATLVSDGESAPRDGAVVVGGERPIHRASALRRRGHDVAVLASAR